MGAGTGTGGVALELVGDRERQKNTSTADSPNLDVLQG